MLLVNLVKVLKRAGRCYWSAPDRSTPAGLAAGHPSYLKDGELSPPIAIGEWHLLLRLEKLTPARLDDEVREQMLQELLDQFLDDRVSKIKNGEGDSLDPFTIRSHDPTARRHF